jgi:hypothetical protein
MTQSNVIVSVNIAIIRLLPNNSYQILLNYMQWQKQQNARRNLKIKDSNLETLSKVNEVSGQN